jgi:hypothetical protein
MSAAVLAASADTPGARLASTNRVRAVRLAASAGARARGVQTLTPVGKMKSSGITPTTSLASPLIWTLLPTMRGSAPKRRCHSPCDRTMTRASSRTSSAPIVRPSAAVRPATRKKSALTLAPGARSGISNPAMFAVQLSNAEAPANSGRSCRSANVPAVTVKPCDRSEAGVSATSIRSPGACSCGSGRKVNAVAVLYTVVTDPMPRPMHAIARIEMTGATRKARTAKRISRMGCITPIGTQAATAEFQETPPDRSCRLTGCQ